MMDGRAAAALLDRRREVLNLRVEDAQLPVQVVDARLDVRREQLVEKAVDDGAHDGGPQHVARQSLSARRRRPDR